MKTTQLPEGRRGRRRRRGDAGGARGRPDPAEAAVAPDLGLPALARHDLRRRRDLLRARQGDDRRQLRDPGVPGGRDRADAAGRRGGRHQHRRDGAHLLLLLLGQGPDLRARHRDPVRAERPADELLALRGRRQRPAERLLRQAQPLRHARRQHRGADGRLVAQGDQLARRHAGREDAHRRHRRPRRREARRRAAADPGRRHLPGARARHDRRRRVGRALRRREARLQQGGALLLLSRASGRAGRRSTSSSTCRSGTSCRRPTSRC